MQPDGERRSKAALFELDHALDELARGVKFRVCIAHHVADEVRDLVEEQVIELKRVSPMIDGAAHDFAQDIVAPFVAGQDAVGD